MSPEAVRLLTESILLILLVAALLLWLSGGSALPMLRGASDPRH